MPFWSGDKQLPLDGKLPMLHTMQSPDVAPVHVWHSTEQAVQVPLLPKLPSGQALPAESVVVGATHWVSSPGFWVNPELQVTQSPVVSAHSAHPMPQTT
jgi:hypothetical protein